VNIRRVVLTSARHQILTRYRRDVQKNVAIVVSSTNLPVHGARATPTQQIGWLVADGWCWYCWLVAGGWFVLREKYCWLVADKPSEQGVG
jgi:hypothetical protein